MRKPIPLRTGHCKGTTTRSEYTSTVMLNKLQTRSFGDMVTRCIETSTVTARRNVGNVITSDPMPVYR